MRWQDIEGWFSALDVQFVTDICTGIKDGVVVELGCYAGKSTAVMAFICKTNGSSYHAVDNFHGSDPKDTATRNQRSRDMKQVFETNMKSLQLLDYINLHKMDSAESSSMFDDESVDFCFVDASHLPEDVQKDINAWWPKIKRGGILGGHDYQWSGVRGVVDAFVSANQLKLILGSDRQCWKVVKREQ